MDKAQQQLLRDPNVEPTAEIIYEGLGSANNAYKNFIRGLNNYDISLMDWRFYNDGKSWLSKGEYKWTTPRGTNKVKPIFWLSIWNGFFKVTIFFSEKIKDELLTLPISNECKELIENTKINGEKMRFLPIIFDITDDNQLDDVYVLVKFRKEKI